MCHLSPNSHPDRSPPTGGGADLNSGLPQSLQPLLAALFHVDHISVIPLQGSLQSVDGLEDRILALVQFFLEDLERVHLEELLLARQAGVPLHRSDGILQLVQDHVLLPQEPREPPAAVQDPLLPLGGRGPLPPVQLDGVSGHLLVLGGTGDQVEEREQHPEEALIQDLHGPRTRGSLWGLPLHPARILHTHSPLKSKCDTASTSELLHPDGHQTLNIKGP